MVKVARTYSPEEALSKLQNICSQSEKCIYDLMLKLQRWEISPADSERIIESLLKSNFVNEERYVRAYIQEKLSIAKWGRQKIIRMLKAKRLPVDLIERILKDTNHDKYKERLLELLKKKNLSLKDESEYIRKTKLLRFALSRGFEYDLVYELLSSLNLSPK